MQEKTIINYSLTQLLRDLWRLTKSYHWRFFGASLLQATSDLVWLYPAVAFATFVTFFTHYVPGDPLSDRVLIAGILWIAVSIYHYISQEGSHILAYNLSERMALDAQFATYNRLFKIDLAWHEKENTGNKMKRIQRGGRAINDLARMFFDTLIGFTIQFVGTVTILGSFNPTMAWLMIFFIVSYYPLSFVLTKRAIGSANEASALEEAVSGIGYEAISNIRSVKVLGMNQALRGIIKAKIDSLFRKIQERIFKFRTRGIILKVWAQIFRLGSLFFVIWLIVHGRAEVGFLVLTYDYFGRIWQSVDEMGEKTHQIVIAQYEIGRMQAIFDAPTGIDTEQGKQAFPRDWSTIELRDVSFSYGKRSVLKNLSLTIKRGERVGIVGISGAGKSTLFKLLLKEYEDYRGEILIDGVRLRDIARSSFFKHSAVVLQDTEVFNFSLRDNIALASWKQRKNEKLLAQAAKIAHVTDFMNRLPEGYDTFIGEKGVRLSGGEKQRVGIARAVFKQPDILFMDEATSHLDSESEAKIQDSLQQFFQSVTAVVIAHRLSTIKQMDTIYVIEEGSVIESGSFKELLAAKGRFSQMWKRQQF